MSDWGDDDGGASAAAVPLPSYDVDMNFGPPVVSAKKNNIIASAYEVPADTPADTPAAYSDEEEDWGPSTVPAAAADLGFGDVSGSGDANPVGEAMDLTGDGVQDDGGAMTPPPVPKPKRVIRPDLIPDRSSVKAFHEYFIAELSEQYEDAPPRDDRELPLRRQEDYYIFSKELAASARAGADHPQEASEKESRRKSHIYYNGDRKTTNHKWTDFEIRLLLCLIIRGVHQAGTPRKIDRLNKRKIAETRRQLNASLPPANDGHKHRGQWAYHDVQMLMSGELEQDIPVVDVRHMIHRLVDQRKGALHLTNRVHAPRMTKNVALAWRRQQDFVGDLNEWKGEDGRKAILEKDKELVEQLVHNTGIMPLGVSIVYGENIGQGYTADVPAPNPVDINEDFFVAARPRPAAAFSNDFDDFGGLDDGPGAAAPAPVIGGGAVFDDDFGASDAAVAAPPGQAAGAFDDWDGGDDAVPAPAAPWAMEGVQWDGDAEEMAVATTLFNATQAMSAPAAALQRVASPLGDFGLEDPFAAPLPGNFGFANAVSANAAAAADNGAFDDWDGGDTTAGVAQPANNNFTGSAMEVDDVGGGGDVYDDSTAPATQAPSVGTSIPGGNAEAFLDSVVASTNITSPPAPNGYQSGGFTAVNRPSPAQSPPTPAPAVPAQSHTIVPATGFNAERLAMLSREDTPPPNSPNKAAKRNSGDWSKPTAGAQIIKTGGFAGSNAIPLAFNRMTGKRAEPAPASTSAPVQKNAVGRSGGGASTPDPGWSESPKAAVDGGGGDWDVDTPPANPEQPTADATDNSVDADGGDEVCQGTARSAERQYVDLDGQKVADLELDY